MLTGLLGIRLILKLGKSEPTPAPYSVMTALKRVQVTNDTDGNDGFQMTFSLGKDKMGDYTLLSSGVLDPDTRVVIGAVLGLSIEPLIDGVIYHQQVTSSSEPGQSTLTVTGRDISVKLSLEHKDNPHKAKSDSGVAEHIIESYGTFKIKGAVTATTETPTETVRITQQTGESDLELLRRLAERNGYVFYIEPLSMNGSVAYWGPEKRGEQVQESLKVNMGPSTNVMSLNFTEDVLSPIKVTGSRLDPETKQAVKIADQKVPGTPLAQKEIKASRTIVLRCVANKTPKLAENAAVAEMTNAPKPVSGTGTLDTVHYGGVLRARRGVKVAGAGRRNDGLYNVSSVTHEIEPGKYTQQFTLSREGTGPK